MIEGLINNQLLSLLAIIFLGYSLGHLKFKGISLGNSACLFVALAAGAFGGIRLPEIVTDLGIVFFVYAIGLQAGPRFFHLFNRRGLKFSVLAIFTVMTGAVVTIVLAMLFGIKTATAVGIFAGSMTSTPALASAINAIGLYIPGHSSPASLAYAITYPFGLISEILTIQLLPKIFSKTVREEKDRETNERLMSGFHSRQYRLLNANLVGKKISEIDIHKFCSVNITRFKRGNEINQCLPDTTFELGDVAVAVGTFGELDKFQLLFGEEVNISVPKKGGFDVRDVFVSGTKMIGRSLRELQLPESIGIIVTRLYRGDSLIAPTGSVILEIGDLIKVAGLRENIDKFVEIAGAEKRRLDDTNILILSIGMFLGALLGEIPFEIGNFTFKLGMAGGPLLVALLVSHFGKIGKWSVRVPNATKVFLRDLGLVFFLIGIGTKTGFELATSTIQNTDNVFAILGLGAAVSLIVLFSSIFLVNKVFRVPLASSLGAVCGAKTSGPSLGALIKTLEDDTPTIAYAAAYPVAAIMLTIMGQLLVWIGINLL